MERVLESHSPTLVNPLFIQPQAVSHRYSIVFQEEKLTALGWSSKVTGTLFASRVLHLQPAASPASFSLASIVKTTETWNCCYSTFFPKWDLTLLLSAFAHYFEQLQY